METPNIPNNRLTIGGTNYDNIVLDWNVKLRDCNYTVANFTLDNRQSRFYNSVVDTFTEAKFYVKDQAESTYTQIFGGYARQLFPTVNSTGSTVRVYCKGYGAALAEMHCNKDFGYESSSSTTYDELSEIVAHVVNNYTEKSFDDWASGYSYDHSNICEAFDATTFSYINNPYRKCADVINHCCDLATAVAVGTDADAAPAAAGPHWIVRPTGGTTYFLLGKIGDHSSGANSPETYWPDWWGVDNDQASSTLVQGEDFYDVQIIDKSSEFANSVVLITDFRRPSYDYWTEDSGGQALWGNDGLKSLTDDGATYIVGSHSLDLETDAANQGDAYYPSTEDAGWNIEKWGSKDTVPRVNFYYQKDANINEATTYIYMFTTDHSNDYFYTDFCNWHSDPDNEWIHVSLPIGPYYKTVQENKRFRWGDSNPGTTDWADINGVSFRTSLAGGDAHIYIDDLHFSGKIIRQAYCSDNITTNKERQKVVISRMSMDDLCVSGTPGTTDTGDAARTAKAELFRRIRNPRTVQFTVALRQDMLAGQKTHVHAFPTAGSTYTLDSTMRILQVEHGCNVMQGAYSRVTATDDIYNTHPISTVDAYALMQEFTLRDNREALNMRAGAEVDLLIGMLKENYNA